MKKYLCLILILSVTLNFILTGCSVNEKIAQTYDETFSVVDHNGDTVVLPKNIERIAVCDIFPLPSVLAVFFDSAHKIVAMSPTSMSAAKNGLLSELYPEILGADTSAISGITVNTEELMKLDPQVVFYNASSVSLGETLKRAGFNAVAISVDKWGYNAVETLKNWITLLSEIFPECANDRLSLVESFSEDSMQILRERTRDLRDEDRKNVFFLFQYSEGSLVTSGSRFFGQWWADAIGALNAAQELIEDNSVKVTLEEVYLWDPDVILVTNFTSASPEDIYDNTVGSYDWSGISAVQNKRVYKMPLGMYRSFTPGIDTPVTLLWLAKTVYPELFADIDITEKTVGYYDTVFGVKLTKEQAKSIFSPTADTGKTDF